MLAHFVLSDKKQQGCTNDKCWPLLLSMCASSDGHMRPEASFADPVPWVQDAGVPIVPGSDGLVKDPEDAIKIAREVSEQPHILHHFAAIEMMAQSSLDQHV